MGTVATDLIPLYENDDDRRDARPTTEIGAFEARRQVELMRTGWDEEQRDIVFLGEVPVDLAIVHRPLPTDERTIGVWRFEIEAPVAEPLSPRKNDERSTFGQGGGPRLGDDVIVTEALTRSEWTAPPIKFKPARPKRDVETVFDAVKGSAAEALKRAQGLAFDPWNGDAKYMTATFVESAGGAEIGDYN